MCDSLHWWMTMKGMLGKSFTCKNFACILSYKPERYLKGALFINSASVYRLLTPFVRQLPKGCRRKAQILPWISSKTTVMAWTPLVPLKKGSNQKTLRLVTQNKMHHACKSGVTQDRSYSSLLCTSHEHRRKLFLYSWPAISSLFLFKLLFLSGFLRLLFTDLGVYGGIPSKGLVKM